jgi:hypothetical protein
MVARAEGSSRLYLSWGRYGLALAALLRGDHARALGEVEAPIDYAVDENARALLWRSRRVRALALEGTEAHADAEAERRAARGVLASVVESAPAGELRDSFTARNDVAEVLSWEPPGDDP